MFQSAWLMRMAEPWPETQGEWNVTLTRAGNVRVLFRVRLEAGAALGEVHGAIVRAGGEIVAMETRALHADHSVRDITVAVDTEPDVRAVEQALDEVQGVKRLETLDRTFLVHVGGKIATHLKVPVVDRDDLAVVYTPGVARVCEAIRDRRDRAFEFTIRKNTVAVVSDGSAVLGLGNIGPEAAMPVMEGKAMLFKRFADVDAFPICLATQDVDEIVETVERMAPSFGGINLEDISSPRCFEIEERLRKRLDIPVFHDDQHGTAVVMLAGLINALKIVNKRMQDVSVVVAGVGAAGVACTKILLAAGVGHIVGVDRVGIIERGRHYDNPVKQWYAENTNSENRRGTLEEAVRGADVFIGVSGPGILTVGHVKQMARDPIVFAMANPIPEILPEVAAGHVRVMATGRSDYPNQINNVLCFPGMFRGALDVRARDITEEMKQAAALAIAECVPEEQLSEQYIIPSPFDPNVVPAVSRAVQAAAVRSGVARAAAPLELEEEPLYTEM
ncbi:Malate dehydrogenase (oxaloacetate- decarboxylating) [Alicyclobacillus acidocaldarius subsp. acidocaldarius DSM 446]|uniref:Malate dehydrogenase (Oxaloacetate-decarboxylating) n=1 Tax=Alicyclobacillus acidocaldarius subsp. acidocaldarius (strain ATCC 27009 / DSM 446 / BCRC 14685 / JCM 5260 / KCTC 1825 / NBRC 15652 / NCIMB 11725 / NRRL B-14509 / 104-IA) TaxID=521098 RepID=C8WQM6_ALIAD|nr:Malate dehydrogenase (oxaloacetate- decarboxylating) [Alicyclobacillus acidocaldarius subsp. acidocaldarius DSM 446]